MLYCVRFPNSSFRVKNATYITTNQKRKTHPWPSSSSSSFSLLHPSLHPQHSLFHFHLVYLFSPTTAWWVISQMREVSKCLSAVYLHVRACVCVCAFVLHVHVIWSILHIVREGRRKGGPTSITNLLLGKHHLFTQNLPLLHTPRDLTPWLE